MNSISQLNASNLAIQLETSKYMDDFNNSLAQNIIMTGNEFLEDQSEDQQFRNQLESIKLSQSNTLFKANMDQFKNAKDNQTKQDNSSDKIETPRSNSERNVQSMRGEEREVYRAQKYSLRTLEEGQFTKHFNTAATYKNFISNQQNELAYLSPKINKSFVHIRSSFRENTIHTLSRSASKNRTNTYVQLKTIANPAISRIQGQSQLGMSTHSEVMSEDTKKQGQNNNFLDAIIGKDKKPQKRNLLKQIYYIRRITNIMKQRLDKKRIFQLQQHHYHTINDKSYFYQPVQVNKKNFLRSKVNQIFSFLLGNLLKKIEAYSPDSFYIMLLNFVVLIMQLLQLIVYPLKSAFQIQALKNDDIYDYLFHHVPITIGIFEICVHFNISYYEHGNIIQNKAKIFWKYTTNKFLFDIVCLMIVQFNYYYDQFIIDLLFAICSLKKILMNLKNINEHFQIEQRFSTTYDLINLSLIVFYMGHYCACGYYFIGSLNFRNNWVQHYGFMNESWVFNYVNSIYFTFITMITVGFGDIAPINMIEKIYVIFMTIVSCGVFAYSVNTIGRIFSEMALKESKYKSKKFEITKLMQQRNITKKTQRKVLKFIEYEQNQEKESYQKGEEILINISKSLRDEVNREYFGKFLNDIKLFRLNFSKDFLMKLTSHIKERTYGPNEIIFSQGDLDRNFYFICNGSVQLYMNSKVSQNRDDDFDLVSIGKGALLGLNSFLTNNPKEMSAKSLNVCHLIYCSEHDFIQTIKFHEQDYVS